MLAGLEEKDFEQKLSTKAATTHVMLVFLKEKKVNNTIYSYNLNTNYIALCLQSRL